MEAGFRTMMIPVPAALITGYWVLGTGYWALGGRVAAYHKGGIPYGRTDRYIS